MILKDCPFCSKPIPRAIRVCPYCHLNEQGKAVQIDPAAAPVEQAVFYESDLLELSSDDPYVREQAVVRMARHGFGIVQSLISILSDHSKSGLAGVARSLGRIRDRRSIPVLAQAARLGDENLRPTALWALSQFREPEVLPILISEADRPPADLQGYLAFVVGGFQDAQSLPLLSKLARHTNREVAFQAVCALGETNDATAIPALRRAFRRRDPLVRAGASAALKRLGASPLGGSRSWIWLASVLVVGMGLALVFWHSHK